MDVSCSPIKLHIKSDPSKRPSCGSFSITHRAARILEAAGFVGTSTWILRMCKPQMFVMVDRSTNDQCHRATNLFTNTRVTHHINSCIMNFIFSCSKILLIPPRFLLIKIDSPWFLLLAPASTRRLVRSQNHVGTGGLRWIWHRLYCARFRLTKIENHPGRKKDKENL